MCDFHLYKRRGAGRRRSDTPKSITSDSESAKCRTADAKGALGCHQAGTCRCQSGDAPDLLSAITGEGRALCSALELFDACQSVSSRAEFIRTIHPLLAGLLPHSQFICGVAATDTLAVAHALNVSFPADYVRQICDSDGRVDSPLVREWLRRRAPVHFSERDNQLANTGSDGRWKEVVRSHGITSLAAHGMVDINGRSASYFCFGGVDAWTETHRQLLRLVVPHLHQAMVFLATGDQPMDESVLSPRELEVLSFVCRGKTNYEISRILEISPWTIKIHVKNLMTKLDVSTRSHAVAKAMRYGIIRNPHT
jgi:transcriptional regulator EpsA